MDTDSERELNAEKSKKIVRDYLTKSHILQLPPGTFSSGKEYSITCLVIDKENDENKTSEMLQVNILERGMQISTFTKNLKLDVKQPINIKAFFSDPDFIAEELTFEWKCSNSNNEACEEFRDENNTELSLPEGFSSPGSYQFTVTAKKGTASVEDSSLVEIGEELLPVIKIDNAVTSCNPSDGIQISAHVSRLVPGCTLQWTCVQNDTNYDFIDLNILPGKLGSPLEITDEEDNVENLSEEIKNDDDFIDEQHDLSLSPSDDGSWEGLKSGSKYLFRLVASCPCLENNISSDSKQDKFVISTADVLVTTNQLPILKPLKVTPKSGQAIRTEFNFQTGQPYNSSKPLSYKYGILNEINKKLYLIQQYDTTNAVTILPFHDDSLQTVLEVCDSKNACNFTLGPKVIVKLPNNFTVAEANSLINNFKKSMQEQDYFDAFTLSSMLLQTIKQMPSKRILFENTIKNITTQEIKMFLSETDNTWLLPASNLLKHIKIFDKDIQLPQDTLNGRVRFQSNVCKCELI